MRNVMRRNFRHAVILPAAMAIMLLLVSPSVFAYLDPSTGSMVVTAIVGIFASAALAVKTYWYKLRKLFRRAKRRTTGTGQDSPPGK